MDNTASPTPVSIEALLAHAEWVRGLALALVRDADSASDIEQEVWREAFEKPPESSSNVRGWLAQVARNAVRMQLRSAHRARERESSVARQEAQPSTLDVVAEAELSRSLADHVIALAEPYRTTLLLRYFRSQTVDEIAAQQGVSRETVRTRQRRGLELLRAKLDATHTSRSEWLSALAPWTARARTIAAAGVGGALAWKLLLAVGVVVAACWVWRSESSAPAPSTAMNAPTGEALARPPDTEAAQANPPETKEPGSRDRNPIQAPYPPKTPPGPASTIDAKVLDLKGQPFAGFAVEYRLEHEPKWVSDGLDMGDEVVDMSAQVRHLIQSSPEQIRLFLEQFPGRPGLREVLEGKTPPRPRAASETHGDLHVALPEGNWKRFDLEQRFAIVTDLRPEGAAIPVWVIAPCIHVAGTVVDEEGAPIPHGNVSTSTDIEDMSVFGGESGGEYLGASAMCDERGRFDLPCTPIVPRLDATVYANGFEPRSLPELTQDDLALRIVLQRAKVENRTHVRGIVVDEHGAPVAKASILFGQNGGTTDDHGAFDVVVTHSQPGEALQAVKRGFQPAVIPDLGQYKLKSIEGLVLRLGPAALSIQGRVLDLEGAPVAGAHVQVVEGTPAGSHSAYLEDVADDRWQVGVKSDADGRFILGGLSERTYRIMAWVEKRGLIAASPPIAAGSSDVELRARASDFQARLTGHVVTRRGVPLEKVDVVIELPTFVSRGHSQFMTYGRVSTDAAGRFELHDVPLELVQLLVSGRAIHTDSAQLPSPRTDDVEILARIEMRVRLEVADPAVDRLGFLDEKGQRASVTAHFPHTESQQYELHRADGAFAEFSVTDDVATVILKSGDAEVRRVPLDVRRESRVTLRL